MRASEKVVIITEACIYAFNRSHYSYNLQVLYKLVLSHTLQPCAWHLIVKGN